MSAVRVRLVVDGAWDGEQASVPLGLAGLALTFLPGPRSSSAEAKRLGAAIREHGPGRPEVGRVASHGRCTPGHVTLCHLAPAPAVGYGTLKEMGVSRACRSRASAIANGWSSQNRSLRFASRKTTRSEAARSLNSAP